MTFCVECNDEFDPVENADLDTPLCSSGCDDNYWWKQDLSSLYSVERDSGAPVF